MFVQLGDYFALLLYGGQKSPLNKKNRIQMQDPCPNKGSRPDSLPPKCRKRHRKTFLRGAFQNPYKCVYRASDTSIFRLAE